jgi:hypothetical protein
MTDNWFRRFFETHIMHVMHNGRLLGRRPPKA